MTGKIIGKRVVPDVFEVYEKDVGTSSIKFSVNKVNDGVNFLTLNGYAHVDFESGRADRIKLAKTIVGNEVFYELLITKGISYEEGRHRIQLSFESDDLSVVYKTCIFTFVVCESIDGNLAYENLIPSVVNELEEKMEETLLQCSNLKDETSQIASQINNKEVELNIIKQGCNVLKQDCINIKQGCNSIMQDCLVVKQETDNIMQETVNIRQEIENIIGQTPSGAYVTSVNSKTGDVVLTASDIEGLESVSLEPLIINGVTYDGKSQVNINVNDSKNYQIVYAQDYDLHLENQSCVYIKSVERLNLYSDKLEGLDGCFCEIYFTINNEPILSASSKFYFYGDSCYKGMFKPIQGNYYLRFYSIEKNAKIYVEVKKLENKNWNYSIVQGFPAVVNYESGVDYVNDIVINGALKKEVVNGSTTIAYPIGGVGEPFLDENGCQKYKIDIVTRNANLLDVPYYSDGVDSYSVAYDEYEKKFRFYGVTYMEYETIFPLNSAIEKNTTICLSAFSFSNYMNTSLTNGRVLEFTLSSDNADLLKLGIDYMGNPCAVEGYSSSGYITEDIKYLKIKVLERAIETEFDNLIGIAISKNEPMQEYEPSTVSVSSVVIDEPLLLLGNTCDKLYLKEGYISKNIAAKVIHDKSELAPLDDSENATAIIRYDENFPVMASYLKQVWIHGKTQAESLECLNISNSKYLEFKMDYFGTYKAFDEGAFPIVIVYPAAQRQIRLPLSPIIKVFEGETTFNIVGGEKPSGGSVPNIKK